MTKIFSDEIRINGTYASKIQASYDDMKMDSESVPRMRYKNVRTETYMNKIMDKLMPTGSAYIIPPNCRLIKRYANYDLVVIEEQPAMRSIRVSMELTSDADRLKTKKEWIKFGYEKFFAENSNPYTFLLAMPYVIHVILFDKSYAISRGSVFFRPHPLLGMSDKLYVAPLLNTTSGGSICYGSNVQKGPRTSLTRDSDHVVRAFWGSTFNTDYTENYLKYQHTAGVCDYFTWQYYSQTNPMFIYDVDWIPYHRTFSEIINNMESRSKLSDMRLGYQTLSDLFSRPSRTGKLVTHGKSKIKRPLLYDICNEWYPEPSFRVNVGDAIKYSKDRVAFIDSFMGISGGIAPTMVRLDVNGKRITMNLTQKVSNFICQKIKELRYETQIEMPDGTLIQPGDIISMKNNFGSDSFKKVHYIRKASDGQLEMVIGSQFFLVDAFDWKDVTKVDIKNPEVDGIKLDLDTIYMYLTTSYYGANPIGRVRRTKFTEVTAGKHGKLVAKFKEVTKGGRLLDNDFTLTLGSDVPAMRKIYAESELQEMPCVYFVGRTLVTHTDKTGMPAIPHRHPDYGVLANSNLSINTRPNYETVIKEFISKDGKKFHAESNNTAIDFELGDKVVVVDWPNPLTMLSIKTLQGFKMDSRTGSIEFVLEDKHHNISTFEYVDIANGIIHVGKIRKVINKIDNVTAGTKIIAKEAGITCFPKKAVNIIVAFVIDTGGEPWVLCSNGCTLWFTDMMEKFERVPMKSKRWATLNHAPLDPSKIKLQSGDLINATGRYGNSRGYLVARNRSNAGLRAMILDYYHEFDESRSFGRDFSSAVVLDCIPAPRLTVSKQKVKGFVSGFPTLHGGVSITTPKHAPYKFIDETGRF